MTYRDTLHRLAGASEATALDLHRRWEAGDLTDDEFDTLLAAAVTRANGRAAAIADLGLAATLTLALGRPVAPLGLLPPDTDPDRLRAASTTLRVALADTPDPAGRVGRLGRSEPLTTAGRTYSTGVAASPHVTGWTRGISGNACELCQWLAEGGRVFPDTAQMATHPGCTCVPEPVTT